MSTTVAALADRIANKLRALDPNGPLDSVYIDGEIRDAYMQLQAKLPAAYSYTAAAGTITAGATTFTLPTTSTAEYAGDVRVQLVSTGAFLVEVTQDEMQMFRNNVTSTTSGRPQYFAPYEDSSQQVICWVYPSPTSAESYNLFRSLVPSDFTSTDTGGTTLALGRFAQEALILKACSNIVAAMIPEDVAKLKLDKNVAELWARQAEEMAYQESARRSDIEAAGHVQRFVP